MVSLRTHAPNVLLSYLRGGEDDLADLAEELHEAAHGRPGHKFSKRRAAYLPQTPFPPVMWRNSCGRCRFWQEGGPGEPGTCHIVGREDDPFGGERIHPRGWCGFWMPPADEPAFAWFRERLHPDGASAVRGKYKPHLSGEEAPAVEIPITDGEGDDGG